ncbi:hypothetical protein KBC55_03940 [Patescibacteria group bacterium]|nr:hypothetical protein [Patescibacteria group bacterium]
MAFSTNSSKLSWLKNSFLLVFSLIVGLFFLTFSVSAQEKNSCTCFCGDETLGALKTDSVEFSSDPATCQETCNEVGTIYIGCYTQQEQYPTANNLCWTQSQCNSYSKERAGVTSGASFGGQSPYCVRQAGSGAPTGYCYADPLPLTLNVPILGVTQIANLATYVNLVYQWLLPAGAIMAVVMVMIAGFQYATAGGNAGQVGAAKERIFQALMGLVLLMGAYTILRFISPDLVKLDLARVPMIKEAEVIDPSLSCEVLKEQYGFSVTPSGGQECGNKGTIQAIPEDTNSTSWKVGDECQYLACGTPGQACVVAADGTGTCVSCDNVNGIWGELTPSETICSSIESTLTQLDKKNQIVSDPNMRNVYMCEYSSAFVTADTSCIAVYSDSTTKALNCQQLTTNAAQNPDNPCAVYDKVVVSPGNGLAVSVEFSNVYDLITDVCNNDPCQIAAKFNKAGCEMQEASQSLLSAYVEASTGYDFVQWWNGTGSEDTIYNACKTK